MTSLKLSWPAWLLFFTFFASIPFSTSAADVDSALPTSVTTPEIQRRIQLLNSATDVDDTQRASSIDLLQQAIKFNATASKAETLTVQYTSLIDEPEAYAQRDSVAPIKLLNDNLINAATSEKLDAYITEHEILLASLASRQRTVETASREARSEDNQAELALSRTELAATTLITFTTDSTLTPQNILDLTARKALQARIVMLEKRELSRAARFEHWQNELDYLSEQIKIGNAQLGRLNSRSEELGLANSNARTSQIRALIAQLPGEDKAVTSYGEEVLVRENELQTLRSNEKRVSGEYLAAQEDRGRQQQRYTSLTEQLELLQFGTTPEFGAALRAQRDQIASTDVASRRVKELESLLTKARLRQFQLDDIQQRLSFESIAPSSAEPDPLIAELENMDGLIVDELTIGYAEYVLALNNLAIEDRGFVLDSEKYANLLDQNLLWMPSTSRLGTSHLLSLPRTLSWLGNPTTWRVAVQASMQKVIAQPLPLLILFLIVVVLLERRSKLRDALDTMQGHVGKVNRDSHSLTPKALLITALLAAPGPIAMYAVSVASDTTDYFGSALAKSLRYGALLYLILELLRQTVRVNGLGELHFRWQRNTMTSLRVNLPWFMIIFIPFLGLNLFIDIVGTASVRDGLGRIAFVIATVVLAVFAYKTMSPNRGIFRNAKNDLGSIPWHTRYVSFPLLVFLPISVTILSVYGFHYTAVQLDAYLLNSLVFVLLALLVFYLAERGIAINERRLALERVRSKRAAAQLRNEDDDAAQLLGEGGPSDVEVQEIDLQTISNQTRELLRVFVGLGLGFVLWNLWSDFIPAFQPLSNVHLWGGVASLEGDAITGDVTLWALLLALVTAGLTFVAGRNIPSLLEVTLLSRLSLEPGTSYAVTTLARYIIVITGSVTTLQLLGAEWSKLQWLVAALSVGLGFGLQEIVANFVSGIVLLFERPIRIGDTVTVGDQFGTVSRIRIRATTIVDWDRREILIPNKVLITERLVNWTLTDPITRTILRVGVAYGSDVKLTEKLLLEIAIADDGVLEEPQPGAVFMSFGESSLDFELRVFVRGVRDLVPVTHALNMAIDRRFRENGIEIAFPQRDIHLDLKPIEVKLIDHQKPDNTGVE